MSLRRSLSDVNLRAPMHEYPFYLAHLVDEVIARGTDAISVSHNDNYYYADIIKDGSIKWGRKSFSLQSFLAMFLSQEDLTTLLPQISCNGLLLEGLGLKAVIKIRTRIGRDSRDCFGYEIAKLAHRVFFETGMHLSAGWRAKVEKSKKKRRVRFFCPDGKRFGCAKDVVSMLQKIRYRDI